MAKERTGDTQEQIDKCLTCTEYKCTNCYENRNYKNFKGAYKKIDERVFMEMYQKGYTDVRIAQEMGTATSTVWAYRKKCGLAPNGKRGGPCKTN